MALRDEFEAFCRAHPVRTVVRDGVEWRYRTAGEGAQGLLLLPGAVGDAEVYFTLAPLVERTHRLVMIAYPNVTTLSALLDGLVTILDRERIHSTDVAGGSYGGMVAQAWMRRFADRTRRVVLSVTGAAKPARAASNEMWGRVVDRLPAGMTRGLLRTIVRVSLRSVSSERRFWRDFYFRAIAGTSKADLVARYVLSADLDRHGPPEAADLRDWTGEMLIIEGDADRIASALARDSLKAIYPAARVHTFAGAGHALSAERPREWAAVVARFLDPAGEGL